MRHKGQREVINTATGCRLNATSKRALILKNNCLQTYQYLEPVEEEIRRLFQFSTNITTSVHEYKARHAIL